jgi:hypothetical protein
MHENLGQPFLRSRPIWCPTCDGNDARYIKNIDATHDLVQCFVAMSNRIECSAQPFASEAVINVSDRDADPAYS